MSDNAHPCRLQTHQFHQLSVRGPLEVDVGDKVDIRVSGRVDARNSASGRALPTGSTR